MLLSVKVAVIRAHTQLLPMELWFLVSKQWRRQRYVEALKKLDTSIYNVYKGMGYDSEEDEECFYEGDFDNLKESIDQCRFLLIVFGKDVHDIIVSPEFMEEEHDISNEALFLVKKYVETYEFYNRRWECCISGYDELIRSIKGIN